MNWMYLVAGLLAAGGVFFHGAWGFVQVPRRLDASTLPSSMLGDGQQTLWMLRLSWHCLTAVFAVGAVALIRLGLNDTGSPDAPRALAAILALLAVAWIVSGGSRKRFLHPGLSVLVAVIVLALPGSL